MNIAGIVIIAFTATDNFLAGDKFSINDIAYDIQLSDGSTAGDNLFTTGSSISAVVDVDTKKINSKLSSNTVIDGDITTLWKTFFENSTFHFNL